MFEASGAASALPTAIACTAKGGILVQVGTFPPGNVGIPLDQITARELDYRGSGSIPNSARPSTCWPPIPGSQTGW